ncbi:putative pectinesterase/pectinesterase inhibitor 24 [Tanacetum coccineum]
MGLKLISLWLRTDLESTRKHLRLSSIKAVSEKSKKRFLIFVKNRIYYKNVQIKKPLWNVMMIGDGMNLIVSARLNAVHDAPTFQTASFEATFFILFIGRIRIHMALMEGMALLFTYDSGGFLALQPRLTSQFYYMYTRLTHR